MVKTRNRQPDLRWVKAEDRFRLNCPEYNMAFDTKQVQPGFRFCMTPSMHLVQRGREFRVDGKKLWNRNANASQAFRGLLDHIGDHVLVQSAKEGQGSQELHDLGKGHVYFMYPQVLENARNMADTSCHMPAVHGFKRAFPGSSCPYTIDKHGSTWYTVVNLGLDKHGNEIKERIHAILAAARWGIPESVFDITLGDRDTAQALHQACCPGHKGGCLNPLHLAWNVNLINRRHQEVKRTRMNRGPQAHGPHRRFRLAHD